VVIPIAGLGGREADDHAAAAIPVAGEGVGAVARGAKLDSQIDGQVGMGMRGGVFIAKLEDQLAGGVGRSMVSRALGGRRSLRTERQGKQPKKCRGQSQTHGTSVNRLFGWRAMRLHKTRAMCHR